MACSKRQCSPSLLLAWAQLVLFWASLALFSLGACSRTVHDETPCHVDTQCSEAMLCIAGECVHHESQCFVDEDCPEGEFCHERQCRDGFCQTDCDCPVDSICTHAHCTTDSLQCYADSDCRVCQNGTCTGSPNPCTTSDDCPDNLCVRDEHNTTCGARRCIEPQCLSNDDCSEALPLCLEGICRIPACYYDYECYLDETRNRVCSMWTCMDAQCLGSYDCEAYELCLHGFCQTRRCERHADCPLVSACFSDGFCREVPCVTNPDICPEGSACGETGVCTPYQCSNDSQCFPLEQCRDGFCLFPK